MGEVYFLKIDAMIQRGQVHLVKEVPIQPECLKTKAFPERA
jgi:hypothetical protein